jgi:hypothetical protein
LVYRCQINNDINYFMREPVLAGLEKSSMVSDENMYKQRKRILQFQEEPDERYQDLMLPKIQITRAVSQTLLADRMPLEFKHDKNIIRYGQTLIYSADASDDDSDDSSVGYEAENDTDFLYQSYIYHFKSMGLNIVYEFVVSRPGRFYLDEIRTREVDLFVAENDTIDWKMLSDRISLTPTDFAECSCTT